MNKLAHLDQDLDLDFIREFAVGGELMRGQGKGLTAADRSERIRIAIYANHLVNAPFRDTGMNYAEAFEACYGRSIEMRRTTRHAPQHATSQNSVATREELSEQTDDE